jgi:hypothetical protein
MQPDAPDREIGGLRWRQRTEVARSERFELPTLGFEVRCSIQLSYERVRGPRLPDLAGEGYPKKARRTGRLQSAPIADLPDMSSPFGKIISVFPKCKSVV